MTTCMCWTIDNSQLVIEMHLSTSQSSELKFLVFGAGAIGSYIGGSLALAGYEVVFVARPKTAKELREKGLRLDFTKDERRKTQGAFLLEPNTFMVADSIEDALKFGPFDAGIFALKSYDTGSLLDEMKPFADKLPPVLCLSNGVENEQAIVSVLGVDKVIYGTVTTAVGRRGAGDIILEKLRGVGIAAGHPLSEKLVSVFKEAYLKCLLYENAQSMKWSKMMTNLLANPTSAILDMSAAEVFENKVLYKLEIAMLKECLAVMKAQRLEVVDPPRTPARALAFATRLPLWLSKPIVSRAVGSGRGSKMPSFHIDLHSGKGKSEVGFLHGAIVREGKKHNIPTPVNELLTNTLLSLTNKKIPLDEFAGKPDKFLALLKSNT